MPLYYYTTSIIQPNDASPLSAIMRCNISLTTVSHFLVTSILLYCHTSRQPVAVVSGLWKMDSPCEKTNGRPGKLGLYIFLSGRRYPYGLHCTPYALGMYRCCARNVSECYVCARRRRIVTVQMR